MTTLTKEQQKKSLFKGKRKLHEKAPKIVLCNPFPKYWPKINETDAKAVENLLQILLVKEHTKTKIPWKKLIKLPKETRKERVKEINTKEPVSEILQRQRKYVKIGLNEVSRAIQHQNISSCLLAGDTQPDTMVSHLLTLAFTRGIPVLIVPKFKEMMYNIIGFSSIAIGITVENDGRYFKSLHELIKELSFQFPAPVHYGWIYDTGVSNCKLRKMIKHSKSVFLKDKHKTEPKYEEMTEGFFIDVTPGPSLREVCATEIDERMDTGFIPLDEIRGERIKASDTPLRDDFMNSILYLAPNFTRMQKNCNRMKKKRVLTI